MGDNVKRKKSSHADLRTRAGFAIYLPDGYTRYDNTPYANYYDAVIGSGFTSERIPVGQECKLS